MKASEINTLEFFPEKCVGCGMCIKVCPHGVFKEGEKVAALAEPDACMECGACQLNCPVGAIAVQSGTGCAYAMIKAALTGSREVCCE